MQPFHMCHNVAPSSPHTRTHTLCKPTTHPRSHAHPLSTNRPSPRPPHHQPFFCRGALHAPRALRGDAAGAAWPHGRPLRDTTSSSALKSEQKTAGGHFHQPTSTPALGGGGRDTPTHKQSRLLVPPNGPQHGAAISHLLLSNKLVPDHNPVPSTTAAAALARRQAVPTSSSVHVCLCLLCV